LNDQGENSATSFGLSPHIAEIVSGIRQLLAPEFPFCKRQKLLMIAAQTVDGNC